MSSYASHKQSDSVHRMSYNSKCYIRDLSVSSRSPHLSRVGIEFGVIPKKSSFSKAYETFPELVVFKPITYL